MSQLAEASFRDRRWNTIQGAQPMVRGAFTSSQNAEHFFLTHHEKFLAIDLNFGARILSEQNAVSRFYIEREDFAFIIRLAFTYR